ncbi:hypothetical protein [Bowmanella sp. JS7-9]|uniref:Uncharacterized protein n=1 Tax=Pseudobowmanella zhangzhouensis TaxID=1537679 RepID=A0ABW1XJZ9_9ALTE|nr:hypothetical protein [Bowmanella sp. JS7-9]TBX26050.1 hypothetical protein TK45_02295 [Bowmanella sp. JS7-9]
MRKANPNANAEKQKRFRERQKQKGHKEVRGYVSPEALKCYAEIADKTHWTDGDILSNSLRITYAAYKCGQIKLLNDWLKENGY